MMHVVTYTAARCVNLGVSGCREHSQTPINKLIIRFSSAYTQT